MAGDTRLIVPAPDAEPWPTLGPEVCDWIEANLCRGPGDVLGEPVSLIDEYRAFIYRAYEVYPRDHERAGRRRFKRAALSRRKGHAKTELAAMLAIAEVDPTAPVRCDGWRQHRGEWVPSGQAVRDPYVPMVAVTEEQTEDLAYGAVYKILQHCDLGRGYDIGLDRILAPGAGEIKALASAPGAREGARTTFQHFDEPHLFTSLRLRDAVATMLRNIPKRLDADAWSLETSTMFAPGEGSVAEDTYEYALAIARGEVEDPRLYLDHRQASERRSIRNRDGVYKRDELVASIREASGDAWAYTDVDSILTLFLDPNADDASLRRFWLNQRRKSSRRLFAPDLFERLADRRAVQEGAEIVLWFDGSYRRDSTVLGGVTVEERPHVFVIQAWEKPLRGQGNWRVPVRDVKEAVAAAMERYEVVEFAPDPPGWRAEIEEWQEAYGDVVVLFDTNQPRRMGPATDDFVQAVEDGGLTHDGSEVLVRHVANCVPRQRAGYTVATKSSHDSPDKVDAAIGAMLGFHRAAWRRAHREDNDPGWRPL